MPKTKKRNAINDLGKDCSVLLLRLSNSDISSLQENSMQIRKSLDLPYRRPGKDCSVLLRRLTESEIRNATKSTSEIEILSELSSQTARRVQQRASKFSIHYGYQVYFELFRKYLTDLKNNEETKMLEKLSERNINPELIVPCGDRREVNGDLVLWLIEKFRGQSMDLGEVQFTNQDSIIIDAALNALGVVEEIQHVVEEIQHVVEEILSVVEENVHVVEENPPVVEDVYAEQTSSECEDISNDKYEEKERAIRGRDYLFPIDAPKIPRGAIILMSDCLGYLNKRKETSVNGNRMRLESAHLEERTEINASQNKMRNKAKDLRKIKKKNIVQRCTSKEEKILIEIMYGIKFKRGC